MNVNDMVAIALLLIAVSDTALAQTVLPRMLQKNASVQPAQIKQIVMLVNLGAVVFFVTALIFYTVRPL